jgi:hypothetical protein
LVKSWGVKVLPASGGRDNGNFPIFLSLLYCFRLRFPAEFKNLKIFHSFSFLRAGGILKKMKGKFCGF